MTKSTFAQKIPKTDVLLVLCSKKSLKEETFDVNLPEDIQKEAQTLWEAEKLEGKEGQSLTFYPKNESITKIKVVCLGEDIVKSDLAGIALNQTKSLLSKTNKTLSILAPSSFDANLIANGALDAQYSFKMDGELKNEENKNAMEEVIVLTKQNQTKNADKSIAFMKELVDFTANIATPAYLAKKAEEIANMSEFMTLRVINKEEMLKEKFFAAYEVGKASENEPCILILEYKKGEKAKKAPKVFIGKGVTYDTGGLNLKPTGHIETMHCDMGGAATTLGLMHYLAQNEPDTHVVGIAGCVENSISGGAYRPGDIIKSRSGKSIKVTNTDAEGRLVLADCLHFACEKYKPAELYDSATLTGAVVVALGEEYTGIMSFTPELIQKVEQKAEKNGELVWELPLTKFHVKKTKGKTCDLLNWTKGIRCGSTMAGAFLSNFVEDGTQWVHFDIAGTAFNGKYGGGNEGATGSMVRTWISLAIDE